MPDRQRYRRNGYVPGYRPVEVRIPILNLLDQVSLPSPGGVRDPAITAALCAICSASFGPAGRVLRRFYSIIRRDYPQCGRNHWWLGESP